MGEITETRESELTPSDLLMGLLERFLIADAASQRATELYQYYEHWANSGPEKSAGSNADANRRPRGF